MKGMAPCFENIQPLTVAEEDGSLIFAHDQLGSELDLGRALGRIPMNELDTAIVKPFDYFNEFGHLISFSWTIRILVAANISSKDRCGFILLYAS